MGLDIMGDMIKRIATEAHIDLVDRQCGTFLIRHDDIEKFLEMCKQYNLVILGIEGFQICGKWIIPDPNAIADFSDLPHDTREDWSELSIQESYGFFKSLPKERTLLFDFCILGDG